MGAKGKPGQKVDWSGLVAACVEAGGESNPNHGNESSGVLNIEDNTTKVDEKDVTSGNIVTFHFDESYPYHTGLIVGDVVKDKDGKVVSFNMIQSSSGEGPNEKTVVIGQGKLGKGVSGFYKFDSKPDASKNSTQGNFASEINNFYQKMQATGEMSQLTRMAEHAEKLGLSNAATYLRAEAQRVYQTRIYNK